MQVTAGVKHDQGSDAGDQQGEQQGQAVEVECQVQAEAVQPWGRFGQRGAGPHRRGLPGERDGEAERQQRGEPDHAIPEHPAQGRKQGGEQKAADGRKQHHGCFAGLWVDATCMARTLAKSLWPDNWNTRNATCSR